MGSKVTLLVASSNDRTLALPSGAALDEVRTRALARDLFGLTETSASYAIFGVGLACYDDLVLIDATEVAPDRSSEVPPRLVALGDSGRVFRCGIHEGVDWGSFALWERGVLVRAFSATLDEVYEDIGAPLPIEAGYWAGAHALEDEEEEGPSAVPFYPPELAEAVYESILGRDLTAPVPMLWFPRSPSASSAAAR